MASQMSGLRHQNKTIKTSTDRLRELLRPLVRAYVLGYASSTTPRLLTLLVTLATRQSKDGEDRKFQRALFSAYRILRGGLELQRFPTFCAALIGGTSLLQVRRSFDSSFMNFMSAFPILDRGSLACNCGHVGGHGMTFEKYSSGQVSIPNETETLSFSFLEKTQGSFSHGKAIEAAPSQAQ